MNYKKINNITGWAVFTIALVVYYFSAERVGSLWDCGEFITGAYKLQVVHPPGAPVFLLIGRMFTFIAEIFSSNPEDISFAVNMLSGICSAFAATFVCWVTTILGKLALVGRRNDPTDGETIALMGAGAVAGLTTAFCTSIWFSAVEGEVYAMSTFFTALTLWAAIKWYSLPNEAENDRWLVFSVYAAGLSMGVHLLSLLTFPALALFYYFKKYKHHNLLGMAAAAAIGVVFVAAIQTLVITGIPKLWSMLDYMMVNGLGMPVHTGLIPLLLILFGAIFGGLKYAHKKQNGLLQQLFVAFALVVMAFSTIGIVVIRANANTPINMNDPSDAMRLLPYLNREQYGERPLLKGPHFNAPITEVKTEDRLGLVNGRYENVDLKASYEYDSKDETLFPRMGHQDEARKELYKRWMNGKKSDPTMGDNLAFFFRYQVRWMYWRYFMWNFSGRQNGEQGFYDWDKKSGNWITGIDFIDTSILGLPTTDKMPDSMGDSNEGRNAYYMLPFLFGLFGMFFHAKNRDKDFLALLTLFIITGLGIIVYSNQPPNEPRERDYVLVGSFFTYAIWIGMGVLALFSILRDRMSQKAAAGIASAVIMIAPLLMGFQNFDDHSRKHHTASRDYASNFLNSCEPNAIIFTYGDNDTYPLWYVQEVEGIRTDVRVVNLSLIAVDWYIDQLRRKVNDSPAIEMTIPAEAYRGKKRQQLFFLSAENPEMPLRRAVDFMGKDNPRAVQGRTLESFVPTRKYFIPVDKQQVVANGTVKPELASQIANRVDFTFPRSNYIQKGELALLDIIAANAFKRPVYFAVTCRPSSLLGLDNYLQLEGLSLRLVPIKSEGDPRYGMVGKGRVATTNFYKHFTEDFRFGNFDNMDLFVDRSYGPSVQTMQVGVMRASEAMINEGKKQEAVQLVDTYFKKFPHMNFTFDRYSMFLLQNMIQAGGYQQAKPYLETLANETAERLNYYMYSMDPETLRKGFSDDFGTYRGIMEELKRIVASQKDQALIDKFNTMFSKFAGNQVPN